MRNDHRIDRRAVNTGRGEIAQELTTDPVALLIVAFTGSGIDDCKPRVFTAIGL
jgi:hypothetical protein